MKLKITTIIDKETGLLKTYPAPKESDDTQIHSSKGFEEMDYNRWIYLSKKLISYLPQKSKGSGNKFLDVGCGAGFLSFEARNEGYEVSSIDISPLAVSYANKKFKLKAVCASLYDFNPKTKYDVIVLNHVFEHITTIDKFIDKLKSLLAVNGYILIASPNYKNLMRIIFKDRWYGLVPTEHVWQFTPATLEKYLKTKDLKVVKNIPASLDYNPPDIFKNIFFRLLTKFSEIIGLGDQLIFLIQKANK